jgi:putative oxidoreductase
MIDLRTAPYAATLLRLTLGAAFLAHAGLKVFVFTPAGAAHFFESLGVPGQSHFRIAPRAGPGRPHSIRLV